MIFVDRLILDQATRRTADGYLLAAPRVARTGIQEYLGDELGRPDMPIVRVYRPEEEVFSKDALLSFGHRPVTIDHPPVLVDASNWKKYSAGQTDADVLRDGEYVRIPMMLMDKAAIGDVEAGKVELSAGYTADIDWTAGVTPDGQKYDAIQRNIRGNHIAVVDRARGGAALRIVDTKPEADMADKSIVLDGITVSVSDTAAQVISKYQRDAETKAKTDEDRIKELEDELAELKEKAKNDVETKDAAIATLQTQLADAQMTPAKLDAAVKSRAAVIDSAKALMGNVVIDGKTEAEIRRQVVDAKLGEKSKGWSDEAISASFSTLAGGSTATRDYADAFKTNPVPVADADKAYQAYLDRTSNAWKGGAN